MQGLNDITVLSDDESPTKDSKDSKPVKQRRRISRGFKPKWVTTVDVSISSKLRRKVEGKCGCHGLCFEPFRRDPQLYQQLLKFRSLLSKMTKLEQDQEESYLENLAECFVFHPLSTLNNSLWECLGLSFDKFHVFTGGWFLKSIRWEI